ncbi:MAG: sigma 54-interacting transcriptional regulator [Deltaproteobacteria bacterium]|nr:sigma 54-interacting transcriptional regulator [Deltaproteobacteria bacterium]
MSDSSNYKDDELQRTARKSGAELSDLRAAATRAGAPQIGTSVLLYHRDGVQIVPLAEGATVVVGRASRADVCLQDDSLSREHARLELIDGEVWVEDLASTNGTRIDGERVTRSRVDPGAELALGAVSASLHGVGSLSNRQLDRCRHDRFLIDLEEEEARGLSLGRSLALVMIRSASPKCSRLSRWFGQLREHLRPFERIAIYSAETIEVLLPEGNEDRARKLVAQLDARGEPPLCGIAVLPNHAGSAGELMEVARSALHQATQRQALQVAPPASPRRPADRDQRDRPVVIQSPALVAVFDTVQRIAASLIPVLLLGETGTGKEIVAQAIHDRGPRRGAPMICINCGGMNPRLVESALFGHERGAFTGADKRSKGVFEAAHGGTVFLDEVGELPPTAQSALLRVLETKRFCRLGSNQELEVDVRVVAATNRDLRAMCDSGEFREDLLYRLDAITLKVPPLRERAEDIEPLVARFVDEANQDNGRSIERVGSEAMGLLRSYAWPGNVRELRNAIERAVVIAVDDIIGPDDLPERVRATGLASPPLASVDESAGEAEPELPRDESPVGLKDRLQRVEAELILDALRAAGWDRRKAAEALGLALRTLSHKMKTHGIKRTQYGRDDET